MAEVIGQNEGVRFPLNEILRQRAYALFDAATFDTIIGYDTLAEAMGLDPQTDARARRAVLRASRDLLREASKKVVNVRTTGYRIVRPNEQVEVSQREQQQARRRYKKALNTVTFVALSELSPLEVSKLMTEQARVGLLLGMAKRLTRVKELPPKEQLALPSKDKLLALFRKKKTPAA